MAGQRFNDGGKAREARPGVWRRPVAVTDKSQIGVGLRESTGYSLVGWQAARGDKKVSRDFALAEK